MGTDSVTVRPATGGDFGKIAALTNRFITDTAIHFAYEPVDAAGLRTSWEKARGVYPWLVAEADGVFAGYAKAGVWRDRTAYSWTPEAGIYVEPAVHRRGVGRLLYGRLIDALRDAGFHSVIGGITLPNDASVRLHESLGFVKVGHVRHAGWKLGQWHDVGFWQLALRGGDHEPTLIGR
ncbi:MAG TPA: GNAT family N-acetyltransferase [Phycisphaerales bacterium]|nr:GNAT family N-acetyltransferase [Phycisphaerales bacterium]